MVNTYVVIRLNGKWVLHVIEVEKNKYVTVVWFPMKLNLVSLCFLSFSLTHSLGRSVWGLISFSISICSPQLKIKAQDGEERRAEVVKVRSLSFLWFSIFFLTSGEWSTKKGRRTETGVILPKNL